MVRIFQAFSFKTLARTVTAAPARGILLLCGLGTVASRPAAKGESPPYQQSYRPRDLYKQVPSNLVLKQVIVIMRHGDRAPIARRVGTVIHASFADIDFWTKTLPSDEMVASWMKSYPPTPGLEPLDANDEPYAQLTTKGSLELRALGVHLKQRYQESHFLPEHFEPSILYARATNIRRTQQSLQNLLLGLYPDGELMIEVRETPKETLYPNPDRTCIRQEEIIKEMREKDYELEEPDRSWYLRLKENARRRLGLGVSRLVPWSVIREVLTCFEVHGKPFPASVDEQFYRDVVRFCGLLWGQWYRHPELLRLGMGRFLEELLDEMKAGLEGKTTHKMVVFSGHDSTLVPVLTALGVYDDVWPPYASNLVIEVAVDKHTGKGYVRTFYNDDEMKVAAPSSSSLRLQHQYGAWCRFDDFESLLQKFIPEDYAKECECKHVFALSEDSGVADTIAAAKTTTTATTGKMK